MGAEASRPRDAPARPLCAGTTYPPPSAAAFPVCHEDVIPSLARCRPISQDPDGRTDFLSGVSPVSRGRVPRSALRSQLKAREGLGASRGGPFRIERSSRSPARATELASVVWRCFLCFATPPPQKSCRARNSLLFFFIRVFYAHVEESHPTSYRQVVPRQAFRRWTFPLDISGEILISAACGSATEALAF